MSKVLYEGQYGVDDLFNRGDWDDTLDRRWHGPDKRQALSNEDAAELLQRLRAGGKARELAEEFGVSYSYVIELKNGNQRKYL